jgi:chromosome segregation ATPase
MLTKEHVRRRIEAGLVESELTSTRREQPSGVLAEQVADGPPAEADSAIERRQRSRVLRLKAGVVEGVLPHVNLTSYRNLQRAHEKLDLAARERDQALAAASEAAGERDRLAVQLKVATNQRNGAARELAELRRGQREADAERERLSAELASATEERERLSTQRAHL